MEEQPNRILEEEPFFEFNKKLNNTLLTFHAGAEFQQSFNTQRIYNNKKGETDSIQTDDEIFNTQGFIFIQEMQSCPTDGF